MHMQGSQQVHILDIAKCGEQHGRFYDRAGWFFREGVDPRNSFGRFVLTIGHEFVSRNMSITDYCFCGEPRSAHSA